MALSKVQKKEMLSRLQDSIREANSLVFTDFSGSEVKSLQALRGQLRAEGAQYKVVKKTLFTKALNSLEIDISLEDLPGNLGVIFADDPVAGAKISVDFAKKAKKDTFKVIGGVLEGGFLTETQVTSLAKLPSKEQLQGQVVGTIAAPISGFLNVLSGPSRGLVTALSAYRDAKQA